MNDSSRFEDSNDNSSAIDALVANYLEKQAANIDPERLVDRIMISSDSRTPTIERAESSRGHSSSKSRTTWTGVGWLIALAASVLVCFLLIRSENSVWASTNTIFHAAKQVHQLPLERCYVVTTKRSNIKNDENESIVPEQLGHDVRLWTQGDQFWVDVQYRKRHWSWGRNKSGDVWLALGDNVGLTVAAGELGSQLERICDLHSMELTTLLDSFPTKWNVVDRVSDGLTHRVTVKPKKEMVFRIAEASLQFDRETKAIRRLWIRRQLGDGSVGEIAFDLVSTRTPQQELYDLDGHLKGNATILSREGGVEKRREILSRWFGATAEQWILDSEKQKVSNE